jgi:hypothetical protein
MTISRVARLGLAYYWHSQSPRAAVARNRTSLSDPSADPSVIKAGTPPHKPRKAQRSSKLSGSLGK